MSGPPFVKGDYVEVDECINDIDLKMSYDVEIRAAMNLYDAEDGDYLGFTVSRGLQMGVKRCSREELAKTHIMHLWLEELDGPVRAPEVYGYKEDKQKVLMFFEYVDAIRYDNIKLEDVITKVIETIEKLQKTGFYHGDLKLREDSSNILVADKIYLIDFETTKFRITNNYYDCFHLFVSVQGKLDGLYEALRQGARQLVEGLATNHPKKKILEILPTAFEKLNLMRVSTTCTLFLPSKILEEKKEFSDEKWKSSWNDVLCNQLIDIGRDRGFDKEEEKKKKGDLGEEQNELEKRNSSLDEILIEPESEKELKPRFLRRIKTKIFKKNYTKILSCAW